MKKFLMEYTRTRGWGGSYSPPQKRLEVESFEDREAAERMAGFLEREDRFGGLKVSVLQEVD